jgi:hypothetical protein
VHARTLINPCELNATTATLLPYCKHNAIAYQGSADLYTSKQALLINAAGYSPDFMNELAVT